MGDFFRGPLYVWLDFQEDLSEFTTEVILGLVGLVNPSMSRLIKLAGTPHRVSRDELDKRFRKARNGQLKFGCVTDWIDADLGILPQTIHAQSADPLPSRPDEQRCRPRAAGPARALDPDKFIPIKHALTLSKLALLDRRGVASVAREFGSGVRLKIPWNCPGLPAPFEWSRDDDAWPDHCHYSVILDMVRSIDGSYQWQGYSMPYPRQKAYDRDHKPAGAGYPVEPSSNPRHRSFNLNFDKENIVNREGFPFYRTDDLRSKVFRRLFPEPFEGEILRRKEFNDPRYPFRPCKEDPFRRAGLGGGGSTELCMVSK